MTDIELVIKIPKELYESYKGRPPMLGDAGMDMIAQSIANGAPLPRHHGRLIDYDDLIEKLDRYGRENVKYQLPYSPTIIEADTAESEEEE